MKRWKKLLLVALVLILLTQLPFAYRRYRLGRLHEAIEQLNSQRVVSAVSNGYTEYTGVVHVHSFLGGHSSGNFDEIIAGAKSNRLNFVVMTEHTSGNYNTAAMTLKGIYDGVLFVNGNELTLPNSDHLLLIPGFEKSNGPVIDAGDSHESALGTILKSGRGKDGLSFVAYPQEYRAWNTTYYEGVEVYNLFTNAREIKPLVMFFDALWSYRSYPDLLFANFYRRPVENLAKWDQAIVSSKKKIAGIAGNDSHSNIGLTLNDDSGKTLLGFKLDPYERSFRLVRVHVLVPTGQPLTQESLLEALGSGHSFVGFDIFCQSSGFSFSGTNGVDSKLQGDEISLNKGVKLAVNAPVPARFMLLKDGNVFADDSGLTAKDYTVTQPGAYRVEVYLPQLPSPVSDQPWIISNPIYVR